MAFVVQAPSKPATPFGQMMAYYLEMQPDLFKTAIEDQFLRLQSEKQAREDLEQKAREEEEQQQSDSEGKAPDAESTGITLSGLTNRIQEVRDAERRATVEDLMYMCILEEFIKLGVGMLPRVENYTDVPAVKLHPLMEDVHSGQAMELVRNRLAVVAGLWDDMVEAQGSSVQYCAGSRTSHGHDGRGCENVPYGHHEDLQDSDVAGLPVQCHVWLLPPSRGPEIPACAAGRIPA
jgi:hypothetical protein